MTTTNLTTICHKCNGTGSIRAFSHYAAGVCFQCKGTGKGSAVKAIAPAIIVTPEPVVVIPGIGHCHVYADRIEVLTGAHTLPVYTDRNANGTRSIFAICDGLKRDRRAIEAALSNWQG